MGVVLVGVVLAGVVLVGVVRGMVSSSYDPVTL